MRKYFTIIFICLLTIALIFTGCSSVKTSNDVKSYEDVDVQNPTLSERAIARIDNLAGEQGTIIDFYMLADFEWDKMLAFHSGITSDRISEKLGVKFRDDVDLLDGLIFVNDGKIVYQEFFESKQPDSSQKFELRFFDSVFYDDPNTYPDCLMFPPEKSSFMASKVVDSFGNESYVLDLRKLYPDYRSNISNNSSYDGKRPWLVGDNRVKFEVAAEVQRHVDYDAFDLQNYEKNVLFLMNTYTPDTYEMLPLDILDVLEYVDFNQGNLSKQVKADVDAYCFSFDIVDDRLIQMEMAGRLTKRRELQQEW